MANYNVGNIEIGIMTSNKNVGDNITALVNQLNKLNSLNKSVQDTFITINKLGNGLQKIQKLNFDFLKKQFDGIAISTKTLNEKLNSIENPKFGETATQLNRLGNAFRQFDKLKDFDFRKMYNSFNSLNRILDPFLKKLKESETSLVAMNGVLGSLKAKAITSATKEMSKLETQTKKVETKSKGINKNLSRVLSANYLCFLYNYTQRIVGAFSNILKQSIDFEETLNKFQVSFGELSNDATKFANQLTYAFNMSTESIMNYMATFNSMLKSLKGLSTTQASELSKTLTQLAFDYSSLFNVGVDRAMSSFQAVLSGQIRQIRSVSGIDVSETSIFQFYKELGGEKSMRQLSQLEKRLLRIYAIERQMDALGAVGDLEKTINSSSNMIKQLQETLKETAKWLGNLARQVFNPLIKGVLSASLVIKDITKSIAIVKGALTTEYDNDSANSLFGSIEEDASDAEDSVKSLLGQLSFDKFESLSSNQSASEDLTSILNAIKNYQSTLAEVSSEARNIADNILTWLGFVKEVDEITGDVVWKLKDGYTNFEKIKDLIMFLVSLGIGALLMKIVVGIATIKKATVSLNKTLGTMLIGSILNIILNWDKMSTAAKVLSVAITLVSGALLIFKNRLAIGGAIGFVSAAMKLLAVNSSSVAVVLGTIAAVGIFAFLESLDKKTKVFAGTLATITAALTAATIAWVAYKGAMSVGTAVPIILSAVGVGVAGVKAIINGAKREVQQYAEGGFPTKGNLFIANEAGPELVGNIGGRTAVANNDMIVQAIENAAYKGMTRALSQSDSTNITLNVGGISDSAVARALFNPMIDEAKRKGYTIKKA